MSLSAAEYARLRQEAEAIVQERYDYALDDLEGTRGPVREDRLRELHRQYGFSSGSSQFQDRVIEVNTELIEAARVLRRKASFHYYHITFTCDPKKGITFPIFKEKVYEQCERSSFSRVELAFEHEDTNFHAHAFCKANHTLNKDNFAPFAKKVGFVLVQHVKKDNGIRNYITKEAEFLYCRDITIDNEWHTIDVKAPPLDEGPADAPQSL